MREIDLYAVHQDDKICIHRLQVGTEWIQGLSKQQSGVTCHSWNLCCAFGVWCLHGKPSSGMPHQAHAPFQELVWAHPPIGVLSSGWHCHRSLLSLFYTYCSGYPISKCSSFLSFPPNFLGNLLIWITWIFSGAFWYLVSTKLAGFGTCDAFVE